MSVYISYLISFRYINPGPFLLTLNDRIFSDCCIFTGCRLVTASNAVDTSASVFTSLLAGDCFTTHSLLQLTLRLAAISHQPPTLLTAVSGLSRNRSCPSLYSLGTNRIENTTPNSYVASSSYRTDRVENTPSQLLHFCVTNLLASNGRVSRAVP
jgi:hypothetical protein